MRPTEKIYRDILARTAARYLTVLPHGIQLAKGKPALKTLCVQILDHGAARTLYQHRQPVCRSLDGLRPILNPQLHCAQCDQRSICTPQVKVHLVYDNAPYRLLLAFTSAKNFLLYCSQLKEHDHALDQVVTQIHVLNRGTWGELRFASPTSSDEPSP